MKIALCYKDYILGELVYENKMYEYIALPGVEEFNKKYYFINFPLKDVKQQKFNNMPYFFSNFVDEIIHNPQLSTLLNVNLKVDSYFDVLYRYACLPQVKTTFYYVAM